MRRLRQPISLPLGAQLLTQTASCRNAAIAGARWLSRPMIAAAPKGAHMPSLDSFKSRKTLKVGAKTYVY